MLHQGNSGQREQPIDEPLLLLHIMDPIGYPTHQSLDIMPFIILYILCLSALQYFFVHIYHIQDLATMGP